jgi:molybdenum cofactor biosynthesis enzyme MoaA
MVVMADKNKDDIIPMAMLTKHDDVNIRFIEEMPFNGTGERDIDFMDHNAILNHLKNQLPQLMPVPSLPGHTSQNYTIEGHKGTVGIIAAWSRTFCSDCNRIRVTATGKMINCLYDNGVLNLKRLLSDGSSDTMIKEAISKAYSKKHKDGFESEKNRDTSISESMSSIGG